MLYDLLLKYVDTFTFLNVFKYITFRTGLSFFTSLLISLLIGGPFIKLFSNKKSPAVALIVNSPGGSPTQSSLIAEKIIKKSQEKNKKVLAFVEDVAASGGYWLACASDEIFVDTNSIAYFPPPLKQISDGIAPENVTCTEGLVIVLKSSNSSPVCIKPSSVEKLIQRGWAIEKEAN